MKPDMLVEVRHGVVVAVYSDLALSAAVLDWDDICEPDGETAFCLIDAGGQPVIGAVVPIPVETPGMMPAETRQVITFYNRSESRPHAG